MHFLYENTNPHFKILKCEPLPTTPLYSNFLLPTRFNPKSPKSPDRRSKRYKYRSCQGGSICLKSSAESREYMLAYFCGMETYFHWGDGGIHLLGGGGGGRGWVEIF